MRINILSLFLVNFLTVCSIYSTNTTVQSDIFYEISQGNLKAVKKWVSSKPDVSVCNDQGQSVLTAAVLTGSYNMVKAVLKSAVDINMLDQKGKTALDWACDYGYEKIVLMFVKKGAKVTNQDSLQQAKLIVLGYSQKIIRRFFIMGSIWALITCLTFPIWVTLMLPMAGPGAAVLEVMRGMLVISLLVTDIYTICLPVQASVWSVRSCKIKKL